MRQQIGVVEDVLIDPDWTLTQELGMAAHALGVQAILSSSATGIDTVIAVFNQNLGLSSITVELVEQWTDPRAVGESVDP